MSIRDLQAGERWQLPDGIEEVLPPRARRIELLRRRLLDECDRWGYELIDPPLLEYLDSLLVGAGSDLDLQTFKVTDQLSGRMMGVRADITSQVARIDAHALCEEGPTRLCYAGTVLRARPRGLLGSRMPLCIGAELYGVAGSVGDAEVVALMVRLLQAAGMSDQDGSVQVELGHVAVYRSLASGAGLDAEAAGRLFEAVQRKSASDMDLVLAEVECAPDLAEMIRRLPELMGDDTVLTQARTAFIRAPKAVVTALDELEQVAELVDRRVAGLRLSFDLAELRGYNYHRGVLFSAYAADHGRIVAGGGRYDGVGTAFGRARPATGFDADLKVLADLGSETPQVARTVLAPEAGQLDAACQCALWRRAEALRAAGHRVISAPTGAAVDERLEWRDGDWICVAPDRSSGS